MQRITATVAILLLAALLSACGQSGPLYMPGNPSQISTTPPEPIEAPANDADEDDDEDSDTP